jgi:hypothetical protein
MTAGGSHQLGQLLGRRTCLGHRGILLAVLAQPMQLPEAERDRQHEAEKTLP